MLPYPAFRQRNFELQLPDFVIILFFELHLRSSLSVTTVQYPNLVWFLLFGTVLRNVAPFFVVEKRTVLAKTYKHHSSKAIFNR